MIKKFKFEKLVRDKIVENIIKGGDKPNHHKLKDKAYIEELKKKLLEEAIEVPREKDPKELVKEIADVQEVIDNLLAVLKVSKRKLKELQKIKNAKAGSFKKQLFVKHVEVQEDSKWLNYYLASPDKYPEIE